MAEAKECSGLDDPRYRITMGQQMAASCTGALITSFIVHPTEIRTSIFSSSAVELNTAGALANYATEAGYSLIYSSPMASMVPTDSSQLTADGFGKLQDQIMYPYAEPNDLQKRVFSSCHF
uniref:(California timema) hypothetical protein n=1 Tax=Timema californicum TaxID=61474 RepID=A0A7R9JH68_TIMCA|nr:unnamed protein product [Timema californicum]